jgi:hypothetical protein
MERDFLGLGGFEGGERSVVGDRWLDMERAALELFRRGGECFS